MIPAMEEEQPTFADRYRLIRRLGQGGMGEVWLAEQTGLRGFRRRVVIKRIIDERRDTEEVVQGFEVEAKLAAQLEHPNIARVEDFGDFEGTPFLAMEYIQGWNLKEMQQRAARIGRLLPPKLVLSVIAEVARSLDYAHRAVGLDGQPLRIVHRDVSPHNIMVTPSGRTKLLDFGIARSEIQKTKTEAGQIKGKIRYLSPEQITGKPLDGRSDQFTLATVLAGCMLGEPLFSGSDQFSVMQSIVRVTLPDLDPNGVWPKPLKTVILKALCKAPSGRFESCAEFAEAIDQILDRHGGPPKSTEIHHWLSELAATTSQPVATTDDIDTRIIAGSEQSSSLSADAAPKPTNSLTELSKSVHLGDWSLEVSGSMNQAKSSLRHHPTYALPFIGRHEEIAAVAKLIRGGAPLITLLGPGGIGKSRVAAQSVLVERAQRPGGITFVDLSDAHDLEAMLVTCSRGLELPLTGTQDANGMIERIGQAMNAMGSSILVLESMEHLVEIGSEAIKRLSTLAPNTCLLITSQRRLGLQMETTFEIGSIPSADGVAIFEAAAQQLRKSYRVDDRERPIVTEIVERLDGLPLAIELAAARVSVLRTSKILDRLSERLNMLKARTKDTHDRQQTLQAAVEWSFRLLSPMERSTMAQCSVFEGGFSLEAAEAVVDLSAFPDAPFVMDLILNLKDRSLLRSEPLADHPDELRFRMFQTIRLYAAQHLGEERYATHERHAEALIERCNPLATRRENEDEMRDFALLEAETQNLLAIADRFDDERGLQALSLTLPVWIVQSPARLKREIEKVRPWASRLKDDLIWLKALYWQIECFDFRHQVDAKMLEQIRPRIRSVIKSKPQGEVLFQMYWLEFYRRRRWAEHIDDPDESRRLMERGKGKGSKVLQAVQHFFIGNVHLLRSETEETIAAFKAARSLFAEARMHRLETRCANIVSSLLIPLHEWAEAEKGIHEVIEVAQSLKDDLEESLARTNLAQVLLATNRYKEAEAENEMAMRRARRLGSKRAINAILWTQILLHFMNDRFDQAAQVMTKAELDDSNEWAAVVRGLLAAKGYGSWSVAQTVQDLRAADSEYPWIMDMDQAIRDIERLTLNDSSEPRAHVVERLEQVCAALDQEQGVDFVLMIRWIKGIIKEQQQQN